MRQKITCPETAHLEEIEFDENPEDGTLLGVRRCSRFHPEEDVECELLCMHRINARFSTREKRLADAGASESTERSTESRSADSEVGGE